MYQVPPTLKISKMQIVKIFREVELTFYLNLLELLQKHSNQQFFNCSCLIFDKNIEIIPYYGMLFVPKSQQLNSVLNSSVSKTRLLLQLQRALPQSRFQLKDSD